MDRYKDLNLALGISVADDQNRLTAGQRRPVLKPDCQLLEKLVHSDCEGPPEWMVQAKGAGAGSYFEVTNTV